jgi:hypothetical protein
VPHLLDAIAYASPQIASALLELGHDDPAAVPYWRVAAEAGDLEAALAAGDTPARFAADLIADLARTDPASVAHLEAQLRDRLDDRWSRLAAARALAGLGVATAELARPLVAGITDYAGRFALPIIRELHAVETIPALEEVLDYDGRLGAASSADDVVWADELLRERITDTIAHLSSGD